MPADVARITRTGPESNFQKSCTCAAPRGCMVTRNDPPPLIENRLPSRGQVPKHMWSLRKHNFQAAKIVVILAFCKANENYKQRPTLISDFWTSIRARYHHLQDPDDDEKESIRLAKCSDAFCASVAPVAGPNNLKRRSESNDDDDDNVPCKRNRSADITEQPDFHPPQPDSDPVQHQPDSRLEQPRLPVDREHRHSSLWDLDLDEPSNMARLPKLWQDMLFICALQEAHLDDGAGLKGEALERLRNPPSYPVLLMILVLTLHSQCSSYSNTLQKQPMET
ncbi:hypothetical protein EV424DRAFT_1343169 [Suillus variegatus]|nr:hypothetical protein EV424DRAFT_1343169 [Suillus variegatus]